MTFTQLEVGVKKIKWKLGFGLAPACNYFFDQILLQTNLDCGTHLSIPMK